MIEVKGLVKAYGSKRALDGLNMSVPKGSIYGLVGPNGAGKTTVLQHICGAMKPDAGSVLVAGEPVFENVQVKSKVAFIPSDFFHFSQATVADMRELYASIYNGFDKQRYAKLAQLFEIDEKTPMKSLSKGMKKQVAFWIVLSVRPDLLLLDEPIDGLDPATRRKVMGVIVDEVAQRNMTVLMSSHNLRELTDVCDYVGIMESGRMHLERPLSELQDNFVKVQVAFADDVVAYPAGFAVLHEEQQGRLVTMVVKGSADRVEAAFAEHDPVFVNILPLSLEEVFIYELGGVGNEIFAD